MPTVPSLRSVAERILRPHFAANLVEDVGSAPYSLVSDLLKLVNADKLHAIESNSPHIRYETDALWADLCVKDFVKIRIAVEDGTMLQKPKSWRDLHEEETEKQKIKLEAVLERMRGHYKAHVDERATIGKVDGVQLAKRRKLAHSSSSSARPKSLFQQAKMTARRAQPIFAPRHRGRQTLTPAVPTASSAFSMNRSAADKASPRKKPTVVTVSPQKTASRPTSIPKSMTTCKSVEGANQAPRSKTMANPPTCTSTERARATDVGDKCTILDNVDFKKVSSDSIPHASRPVERVAPSLHRHQPIVSSTKPVARAQATAMPATGPSTKAKSAVFLKRKR